ncbi:peptidoglycan-binding protein [Granulicella sp. 5B5]|uniref:peptidoglycan-binding domain-containing protein n=1 Tax=Granulicella sp. 5B5 TaxID=1617967 RepID=UPI0015F5CB23|nr:peptidoglycan-binding domain-containing protein [Granulicella sp. 5B5]QMV17364.1 peptidoglycan-binding protein [Granulicella sp. 5B5]
MRFPSVKIAKIVLAGLALATLPAFASTHPHSYTHASVKHSSSRYHKNIRSSHFHEPSGMAPERATEIQQALIKQGYLNGEPSGVWDSQTSAAMAKLQGDNGWQTKITPDSRALIKLGLGPTQPPADEVVASK